MNVQQDKLLPEVSPANSGMRGNHENLRWKAEDNLEKDNEEKLCE